MKMLPAANFKFSFPGGALYGYISSEGLQALHLLPGTAAPPVMLHSTPNVMLGRTLHRLLEQYFSGCPTDFSEIDLDLGGGTEFRQRVWREACAIPYGTTTSYGALARQAGAPRAARAVGAAMGANPVILVVPCHRVLAADGSLGGYGPGLHWKERFLALEQGQGPWSAPVQ